MQQTGTVKSQSLFVDGSELRSRVIFFFGDRDILFEYYVVFHKKSKSRDASCVTGQLSCPAKVLWKELVPNFQNG